MISSIFSLIVRTIILNPMALLGIFVAVFGWYHESPAVLIAYAKRPITYAVLFAIALLHSLLFGHVYYVNSKKINWLATIQSSIGQFMTIIVATALTVAIIYAVNYSLGENLDNYLRYKK